MQTHRPLVTIITVCLNSEVTLEKTITSVLSQTYDNIEYLILDGGSTDSTLEIIRKHENRITKWISEPDEGISDAFNKGITLANGEYIQLVNSDDWLCPDQIEIAVEGIEKTGVDFVFGNLVFYDTDNTMLFKQVGDPNYQKKIHYKLPAMNHPTLFTRSSSYAKNGVYKKYKMAMDYEWYLRAHTNGLKGSYIENLNGNMSLGGISDLDCCQSFREVRDISIEFGQRIVLAYGYYWLCMTKTFFRHLLTRMFGYRLVHIIRKIINPNYENYND